MTTQDIGLFQAMTAKMSYLNQRQGILAQNIANSDTPGYKPSDLKPVDFGAVLKSVSNDKEAPLEPTVTSPMHLGGVNEIDDPKTQVIKKTFETQPDGNSVVLEDQMVKSAQNTMDYNLMTSLYEKNVNILRDAIDSGH